MTRDDRFSDEHRAALIYDNSVVRWEYIKPLLFLGGGLLLLLAMYISGARGFDSADDLVPVSITIAIQLVLGIPALIVASAIFNGSAGTLNLALLRLLAVLVALTPLAIFVAPVLCYGWLLILLAMGLMIMILFDFEGWEAAIVVLILSGINIVTFLILIPALLGG